MVGSIDPRCETLRGTHWPVKVAVMFGTRVAENHLGQRSTTASTGRTYGCKRSDQTFKKTLAARGPSTYGAQVVAEARSDSARQQDCSHRLEAVGDGGELSRGRQADRIGARRVKEIGGAAAFGLATSTGAGAARGDGRIDRSEVRDTPWDPLACKGRCDVWNSRRGKPSWPAVYDRINRPDIWMQAIRSDLQKNSCGTGAVHIWVPAFAGTTR